MPITTRTIQTPYTWSDASFPWNDLTRTAKRWDEFTPWLFEVLEQDVIGIAEARRASMVLSKAELIAFDELSVKDLSQALAETLRVSETYVDFINFIQAVVENLNVDEKHKNVVAQALAEGLNVSEARASEFLKDFYRLLNVFEQPSRAAAFERVYQEAIEVVESNTKHIEVDNYEVFQVLERYVRNANAVISDLILDDAPMTLADFELRMQDYSPPGYSPWKMFVPGDHEFERAVFKVAPRKSDENQELRLTELKVNVDVPDIQERGLDTIPVGGKYVYYKRTFSDVPENPKVTATLKAGTELAIPRITEIHFDKFFVVCERVSDGASVEVDITWTAAGF